MASLVLHQVKEEGIVTQNEINSECRTLAYTRIILMILGLVMVTNLHYRKSKLCKGHRFSNAVKIMLFISDVQNYIPKTLCKAAGSIPVNKLLQNLEGTPSQKKKFKVCWGPEQQEAFETLQRLCTESPI